MNLLLHVFPTAVDLLFIVACIGLLATELWVIPYKILPFSGKSEAVLSFLTLYDSLWRLLGLMLVGLTLVSVIGLFQRTVEMSGLSWEGAFSAIPLVLSETHYGMTWLVRMTAVGVLWFGWWRRRKRDSRLMTWVMMLAAACVVWSVSASSHAADWGDFTWPEWVSWLHIMAGSMWVGGLLVFVLVIRQCLHGQSERARAIFAACAVGLSRLSGIALVLVLATGAYNVWRQLDRFSDLWTSGYGRIILFKLALVGLMAMLGALSRYFGLPFLCKEAGVPLVNRQTCLPLQIWKRWRPSWKPREGDALANQFGRRVTMEAWLALGVLVCAALLGHAMPPKKQAGAIHHAMVSDAAVRSMCRFESERKPV